MISARLIKKNRPFDERSFQKARRQLIEESIQKKQYPTNGSEIAILRKQLRAILDSLREHGIQAEIPEFAQYYQQIEECKSKIDDDLEERKGE